MKYLYLILAGLGAAAVFLVPNATWHGLSILVAMCLTGAFLVREKDQDERVEHLKLKAIQSGFVGAFAIVFAWSLLIAMLRQTEFSVLFFSAWEMVIFTMLIALGLYHFWRWQDGKAA